MNTATVSKWGNSLALRIPKGVLEESNLREGDSVNIELVNGVITLRQGRKVTRYALEEVLDSFQSAQEHPEVDWGADVGGERLEAEFMGKAGQ